MSALWYEYLEESGGEVIPSKYFNHVCKSLEYVEKSEDNSKDRKIEVRYARNHAGNLWWPIEVVESLSEGWLRIKYVGMKETLEMVWWNIRCSESRIQTIEWCVEHKVEWGATVAGIDMDVGEIINNAAVMSSIEDCGRNLRNFERIKVGGYMECWLEQTVGFVWPVRVLVNIGGRLRLSWFGCGTSASFVLFYLDMRLRGLGWARDHGWRYCAPENAGITIAISNADTFARGSPGALCRELCNESEPEEHSLEEGWLLEAVDPREPSVVRPAMVRRVFDRQYFLVELDGGGEHSRFPAHAGMRGLMPANHSGVAGFIVRGLSAGGWHTHLLETHTDRYAPHGAYFSTMDSDTDSAFLPGCKLEAVHPWHRDQIHAATITRVMDGNRLVWVRLDTEPGLQDFLVDPHASVDLFPVGWCEMMHHQLTLPILDPLDPLPLTPYDPTELTIYLYPQCYLGPFLSRSAASQILPQFIGPGLCLPVFRELFHLLLKVSHKPHKLKRLLQLDHGEDHRDLMATVAIASPKSEHSNRGRRPDWLVEVAVRKRAMPEFCRQTALSLGACPWFISTESRHHRCSLDCDARLSAKAGEKMSQQRRRQLFARPLATLGLSYRSLKTRVIGNGEGGEHSNSSGGESDRSEGDGCEIVADNDSPRPRIQTRGVRVPVSESRPRRGNRQCPRPRRPATVSEVPLAPLTPESPVDNLADYVIDPAFLAGDVARVTLASNPLLWTPDQVADYLTGTDCRQLASWLANERVDGPAFLLLTLPILSTLCGLKLEPAIRLCRHVVSLKRAFVEQYADYKSLLPPDP